MFPDGHSIHTFEILIQEEAFLAVGSLLQVTLEDVTLSTCKLLGFHTVITSGLPYGYRFYDHFTVIPTVECRHTG